MTAPSKPLDVGNSDAQDASSRGISSRVSIEQRLTNLDRALQVIAQEFSSLRSAVAPTQVVAPAAIDDRRARQLAQLAKAREAAAETNRRKAAERREQEARAGAIVEARAAAIKARNDAAELAIATEREALRAVAVAEQAQGRSLTCREVERSLGVTQRRAISLVALATERGDLRQVKAGDVRAAGLTAPGGLADHEITWLPKER